MHPQSISAEIVGDVISDIQGELAKLPATAMLRADQESHCMVMISELLRLFAALKEHEIFDFLKSCGFTITIEQLRGNLFLLKSFRIIKTEKYSDATFYVSGTAQYHRLRLAATDKTKTIDALRIRALCLDFFRTDPKHKNWHRAIKQANIGAAE